MKSFYLTTAKFQHFAQMQKAFTPEECVKIIELGKALNSKTAGIRKEQSTVINASIRDSDVGFFDVNTETHWIYSKCASLIKSCNDHIYNYEIESIEPLQFTVYDRRGSKYGKHVDVQTKGIRARKLSFTIQLSDSTTYLGGDLLLHISSQPISMDRSQGTFTVFPSYTLHEVSPILDGARYSLVGWVNGPDFK
jgi:PKHD-type hydroxylase